MAVTCTPRAGEREERSSDLVQSSGDFVYLVPDGRPSSKNEIVRSPAAATKKSMSDVLMITPIYVSS